MGEQDVVFVVYRQTKLKMNNNKIKVSIIVPVYNVAEYITECFNSVASQTFTGGMECIFVDDCGTDDSVDIVRSLISSYHGNVRFRVVNHDHNKGLSAARNTGIRNAKGDYLYFIDSDDSITSDCIEKLTTLAEKYPGVEIVQGSAKSNSDWLMLKWNLTPEYSESFKWIRTTMLKRYVLPMTAWNKLVRRDFVLEHELYFAEGMIHEDEVWNFMLSKYVHRIAFCFDATYNYRVNDEGIMHQVKANPKRYLPIVDFMSKHTSTPYLASELECMKGLLEDGGNMNLFDNYLANTPCNIKCVRVLFYLQDKVNTTTKYNPLGVVWRIAYKMWRVFIDTNAIHRFRNNIDLWKIRR